MTGAPSWTSKEIDRIQAAREGGGFVPLLAFVELSWVLGAAPGWDSGRVHRALDALLNMEGIEVESGSLARMALGRSTGSAGLADHLIVLAAKARGCKEVLTFDARLARTGQARLLKS